MAQYHRISVFQPSYLAVRVTNHLLCYLLRLHLSIPLARSLDQAAQAQVVDDILDPLDVVLDGVGPLAKDVVLEVKELEPGEEVLDEGADSERQLKVAHGHGVGGEAGQLVSDVGEGEEVLLEGDVEGVAVLEVGGHLEYGPDLLEGEEAAQGGGADRGEAAEPGGEDG